MIKFWWETEFKETEIGEVPKDWGVKKLRWAVESLETGNRPKGGSLQYDPKGILSIGGENISWEGDLILDGCLRFAESFYNSLKRGRIKERDILLVKDGATIGKLAFIKNVPEGRAMVNEHVFLIRTNEKEYHPRFLFYFLFSDAGQLQIESLISGSAQGGINRSILDTIKIPKPDLNEQSRIANVLSWFDDLIENKKRQNEILEKTAMAIFKSWFVDFEPFKDEEFVDSEFGRVPKGWKVKPIGEVVEFVKGLSYRSNELVDNLTEGEIFITLKIFKRGGGFRPEYKYYRGNRYSDEQVVYDGDLVIALTDMTSDAKVVGAPALVILPPYKDKGILSLDAAKLNVSQYMKEYAYLYLKDSQEENSTFANGVNVLHLNLNLFKIGKLILIPPQPILQHFHSLVEPLFQKIILNQRQIMVLRKIRDALLPRLVFGKLRVMEI